MVTLPIRLAVPSGGETLEMRKLIATLLTTSVLVFGGVACDDNNAASDKIDEDDTNFGPGDGKDEIGPAR